MAAKQWWIGCGIGCGVLLLACIGMFAACGIWLKGATEGFESAVETRGALDERFGRPGEFTPPVNGAISADRMEIFLAVREATQEARLQLADTLGGLPLSEQEARELDAQEGMEKARSIFGILGSAFGMIGEMGDFCNARNQALLDGGMGMGEYTYIYMLAYDSWLAREAGEDSILERTEGGVQIGVSDFDVPDRVHDYLLEMLDNQLRSLPEDADPEWRNALAAEVDALDRDRDRAAWEDGLPETIAASLRPYRDRLAATYVPLVADFELIRNKKRGAFSYTTD